MTEESDQYLASVIVDAINGEWKVGLLGIGSLQKAFKQRNERVVTKMIVKQLHERSPQIAGEMLTELRSIFGEG